MGDYYYNPKSGHPKSGGERSVLKAPYIYDSQFPHSVDHPVNIGGPNLNPLPTPSKDCGPPEELTERDYPAPLPDYLL